jgi:hypothetical protein
MIILYNFSDIICEHGKFVGVLWHVLEANMFCKKL